MNINEYKIINGIKYLVSHTKNVGRTKLFKLLYFWDFGHFKKFGMSVTCYEYYTYPFGPVPKILYDQILNEDLPPLFKNEIAIIKVDNDEDYDDTYTKFKVCVKPKRQKIDTSFLTPNELNILENVAFTFRDATARQMTELTHLHNSPFDQTVKKNGMYQPIDYFLAMDDESTLDLEQAKEYFTLQKLLCLNGRL